MTGFTFPAGLLVTVTRPEGRTLTAGEILAVPTALLGTWDGPDAAAEPQEPGITFGFGWEAGFAGRGFEEICRASADLGAHLAAGIEGWPGRCVHVRPWPVTDFSFRFEAGPVPVKAAPRRSYADLVSSFTDGLADQAMAARLRDAAEKAGMAPAHVSYPAA